MGPGPLQYRPFGWLLAARTTALLGNAVAPVALAFAVLDLTASVRDRRRPSPPSSCNRPTRCCGWAPTAR